MQWNGSPQAGFSTGQPWLPVSEQAATINVERESTDPASLLHLYRRLIRLRKATPALAHGSYLPLESNHPDCLVFVRKDDRLSVSGQDILVAVNFASRRTACSVSGAAREGRLLLSTHEPIGDRRPWTPGRFDLEADEAVIVTLG